MGTIKDGLDIGIEAIQFWMRFKGRRVRVWPSDLTIRICSESGRKWVTSAEEHEPSWWEDSRQRYDKLRETLPRAPVKYSRVPRHRSKSRVLIKKSVHNWLIFSSLDFTSLKSS